MSLSKSKCWYSNNCLYFLKHTVPLKTASLPSLIQVTPQFNLINALCVISLSFNQTYPVVYKYPSQEQNKSVLN